jgi:Ion channel
MNPGTYCAPADGLGTTRRLAAVATAYRRNRFAWLFVLLLVVLGAGSTLDALAPGYNPLQLLLALNLLAAIASAAREGEMRLPLLLGFGFVAAHVLRAALGIPGMLAVSDGLWVTGIVLATLTSVRHALGRGAMDTERIFAALDAYLLAGLLFGVAYWTLDGIWPGSFGGTMPGHLDLPRAIYFSFVTIATLGYGDVIPTSEPARGLAIVEGVSGQMYMAVLVARLVSLYSQQRDD